MDSSLVIVVAWGGPTEVFVKIKNGTGARLVSLNIHAKHGSKCDSEGDGDIFTFQVSRRCDAVLFSWIRS